MWSPVALSVKIATMLFAVTTTARRGPSPPLFTFVTGVHHKVSPRSRLVHAASAFNVLHEGFWSDRLAKLSRSSARQLAEQLSPHSALGFETCAKEGTMLAEVEAWKRDFFHKVLLVRVGEFYEAWGIDALMLVEHCGLNPMGGKARAGCPWRNLQNTLDGLTSNGLSVAVFEEDDPPHHTRKKKRRSLSQVVTPAAPTYIRSLSLAATNIEFCDDTPPPYVLISTANFGESWTVVMLDVEARAATVTEGLSRDGTKSALECGGFALPLYFQSIVKATTPPTKKGCAALALAKELSEERCRLDGLHKMETAPAYVRSLSDAVASNLQLPDTFAAEVRIARSNRRKPLFAHTAREIGLLASNEVPDLVDRLLPEKHHVASRRWLRRWLTRPPSEASANALRSALSALANTRGAAATASAPCRRKLVRLLAEGEGNALFFRELKAACSAAVATLHEPSLHPFCASLVQLLALESLLDAKESVESLALKAQAIGAKIDATIIDDPASDTRPQQDDRIPNLFFERNESPFLGTVRREAYASERDALEAAALELRQAVDADFPPEAEVVFDAINNVIAAKKSTATAKLLTKTPLDRHRRPIAARATSNRVEVALAAYLDACTDAARAATRVLRELCDTLYSNHIDAAIGATAFIEASTAAIEHAHCASSKGWQLARTHDSPDFCFQGLTPYWLDRATAVWNNVALSGTAILTGPNAAGKSTILRSVAAAALLTTAGLHAPVADGQVPSDLDAIFLRAASRGDAPSLGKSAFAREMDDVALLLRECAPQSLVLVDEIGRGTAAKEAAALCAALIQEFHERRYRAIFATHLREMLPLLPENVADFWRTRVDAHPVTREPMFTYALEPGISNDSLALTCATAAGLPRKVIDRAARLLGDDERATEEGTVRGRFDIVRELLEQFGVPEIVAVPPHREPPPAFARASCVYCLDLGHSLYVGESDNLRTRLHAHRVKGADWRDAPALVAPLTDKSHARHLETCLIRKLLELNIPLASIADAAHGLRPHSLQLRRFDDVMSAPAVDAAAQQSPP